MPGLNLQLHITSLAMMKNVQLIAVGSVQSFAGWRRLESELSAFLRPIGGTPNPYGISLMSFGLVLAGAISYWLVRDPAGVEQALNEMLRR
jgi:hypothetical protein